MQRQRANSNLHSQSGLVSMDVMIAPGANLACKKLSNRELKYSH